MISLARYCIHIWALDIWGCEWSFRAMYECLKYSVTFSELFPQAQGDPVGIPSTGGPWHVDSECKDDCSIFMCLVRFYGSFLYLEGLFQLEQDELRTVRNVLPHWFTNLHIVVVGCPYWFQEWMELWPRHSFSCLSSQQLDLPETPCTEWHSGIPFLHMLTCAWYEHWLEVFLGSDTNKEIIIASIYWALIVFWELDAFQMADKCSRTSPFNPHALWGENHYYTVF